MSSYLFMSQQEKSQQVKEKNLSEKMERIRSQNEELKKHYQGIKSDQEVVKPYIMKPYKISPEKMERIRRKNEELKKHYQGTKSDQVNDKLCFSLAMEEVKPYIMEPYKIRPNKNVIRRSKDLLPPRPLNAMARPQKISQNDSPPPDPTYCCLSQTISYESGKDKVCQSGHDTIVRGKGNRCGFDYNQLSFDNKNGRDSQGRGSNECGGRGRGRRSNGRHGKNTDTKLSTPRSSKELQFSPSNKRTPMQIPQNHHNNDDGSSGGSGSDLHKYLEDIYAAHISWADYTYEYDNSKILS